MDGQTAPFHNTACREGRIMDYTISFNDVNKDWTCKEQDKDKDQYLNLILQES